MSDSAEEADQIMVKPEPTSRTRRKPSQVSDEETEEDQDATSRTGSSPATARKRVRLNGHSNGGGANGKKRVHADQEEEEEEEQDEDGEAEDEEGDQGIAASENAKARSGEKKQLVRDDTGYVTGSIVRIACQSFLTYDQVEFRPGPALNMIIGPNGTGKSTIACAIAIGLGFPAKVLGRSTKLSSYCKNDSNEECWIEIELKGHPGEDNLVVRRYLSRDSEKTKFYLDGKVAKVQEVGERMEALAVQVGNLCTFLPQDRVAAFAMMSHSELLQETEKAAGDVNLSSWHQILIDEFKAQKEKQINVDTYSKKLDRATGKQADAEKEVQQFQQRKQYEQDLGVVEILTKYARYQRVFEDMQRVKSDKNRLENEVNELEAKNKPFKDSKELLHMIAKNSAEACSSLEKKHRTSQSKSVRKKEEVEKNSQDSEELALELKGIRKEEESRKSTIRDLEKKIERLRPIVGDGVEPEANDTTEIDAKIHDKSREKAGKEDQIGELVAEINGMERTLNDLNQEGKNKADRIQHLNQAHVVREKNTAQHEPACWEAVRWLRENKHRMKGECYEPARLSVFPKENFEGRKLAFKGRDEFVLQMIEGGISRDAFRTFLFEKREDYDFFMRGLADTRGLKINATELNDIGDVNRLMNQDQLKELGFDALACDMLHGPRAVIAWLANEHSLGRVPLQIIPRPLNHQKLSSVRGISRYYTREGSVSVKISQYGKRNAMTESRALKNAAILSGGVDEEVVKQLRTDVDRIKEEIKDLLEKKEKRKQIGRELHEQVNILGAEKNALKDEKDLLGKARQKFFQTRIKLQTYEKQLDRELAVQERNSGDKKREQIARDMKKVMVKRVRLALEYKDFILENQRIQNAVIKLQLQALQADSDHRTMEQLVRERDEELEKAQSDLSTAKKELKSLKNEGTQLLTEAQTANEEADEEINERVQKRREDESSKLEELETERDEIVAKLQCMIDVSPAVLEAYKKRKGEIIDLTEKLEEATEELDQSKELIADTKSKWLPKLETLVQDISQRFTASFDTLGLLGEVRLAQDDDYEKWGIEIMVSFRDKDAGDVSLHVLSGQRQSGGERALTTVTYLLALAELARAPFALVDEINQGMDQRAERNMHKMLVETTCKDDVGQYFLLTPKLLPDLVYHEKMKVLVINSGSFIPEDLSLKAMVEKRRQLNRERRLGRIEVPPV